MNDGTRRAMAQGGFPRGRRSSGALGPAGRCAALFFAFLCLPQAVVSEEIRSYSKRAPFEDVKFELTNQIIARGLNIDFTGQIGRMLERTGPDVGSVKPLYTRAEYLTFCSAKLSRAMMEASLTNIGFCPYIVFIYEAAARPGETVVGYRRPANGPTEQAVLAEIDALLDGIVKGALE